MKKSKKPPIATSQAESGTGERRRIPRDRYVQALQQEDESIGQLRAALRGWPVSGIERDLGEDLLVGIYDDGCSSGLSFCLQAKSTKDLWSYELVGQEVISYDFKTKDLEHWEDSVPSVVLVVWDVTLKLGIWLDVTTAIKKLDARGPNWNTQEKVAVHLPTLNRLDTPEGKRKLRLRLAYHAQQMVARGRPVTFTPTFSFPPTTEGRKALAALTLAIETGEEVNIPGEYITSVKFSDFWERLYGPMTGKLTSLQIKGSPSKKALNIELVAEGPLHSHVLELRLKRIKGGTKKLFFSNKGQSAPVTVNLVLPNINAIPQPDDGVYEININLNLHYEFPASTVKDTLEQALLFRALYDAEQLVIRLKGSDVGMHTVRPDQLPGIPSVEDLDHIIPLLRKLKFVEPYTKSYGNFNLAKPGGDVGRLDLLVAACRGQSWTGPTDIRATFDLNHPRPDATDGETTIILPMDSITLFGLDIPLKRGELRLIDPRPFWNEMRKGYDDGTGTAACTTMVDVRLLDWSLIQQPSPRSKEKVYSPGHERSVQKARDALPAPSEAGE